MRPIALRIRTVAAMATVGLLIGCGEGPELAPVSGTVLLDGQPLPDALVLFTPSFGGRPSAARTDKNGEYRLVFSKNRAGALLGEHLVRISTFREGDPDSGIASAPEQVPSQFNAQSTLTRSIEQGRNRFDFEFTFRDSQPVARLASRVKPPVRK